VCATTYPNSPLDTKYSTVLKIIHTPIFITLWKYSTINVRRIALGVFPCYHGRPCFCCCCSCCAAVCSTRAPAFFMSSSCSNSCIITTGCSSSSSLHDLELQQFLYYYCMLHLELQPFHEIKLQQFFL